MALLAGVAGAVVAVHTAPALPQFEFSQPAAAEGWAPTHDVAAFGVLDGTLRIEIVGSDPYINGPARDYPEGVPLWLELELESDTGGLGQIFYYRQHPTEADSARFPVPGGQQATVRVPLPPLGSGYRLRFDPPGDRGICRVHALRFAERLLFAEPDWPVPDQPDLGPDPVRIQSGPLELRHSGSTFSSFEVAVADQLMAVSHNRPVLGYQQGRELRWMELGTAGRSSVRVGREGKRLAVALEQSDADGGQWKFAQHFQAGADGEIHVECSLTSSQDRDLVYFAPLSLIAGLGSFGTNKQQALFPGLEYLANESSSSEADVRGPAARRQVPDAAKITLPLMVVMAESRYVALAWEPQDALCAVFDSPDRLFGSGGQLMQLLVPGSDGNNREEGRLLPYFPMRLAAGVPLTVRARLFGGQGRSVVAAVQQYAGLTGWPDLPDPGLSRVDYYQLAAQGWLDSKIREGSLYRHAYWPGFGPQPAADAALWMEWLADRVEDRDLAGRLRNASAEALREVAPRQYYHSGVGHVRYPAVPLAYGAVEEGVRQAREAARQQLSRFVEPGRLPYVPTLGKPDYGSTHWEQEANGLAAPVVANALEAAAFAGDWDLIREGLRHLRALDDRYRHSVPRGAQTWEIPLHTPDILASAYLVRAFVLGYELTGDRRLLERAIEWAWTGVPFVYLTPPTPGRVGLYSTIAVLGATGWQSPVWFGQPVQWCGLVYADALRRLARAEEGRREKGERAPAGKATEPPWRGLANGIALAGIQHTWPELDPERPGLLPDFFLLRAQRREGPAINPATVLASARAFYEDTPVYEFRADPAHGYLVHAPGRIAAMSASAKELQVTIEPWTNRDVWLLLFGFSPAAQVELNGRQVGAEFRRYEMQMGAWIITLEGRSRLRIAEDG